MGCRQRCPRSDLVRVVVDPLAPGVLVVDVAARLPGRGAWVHRAPECLDRALRVGAFGRALRHAGALDTSALAEASTGRTSTSTPRSPRKAG
ncbi:MAG: YlxR family protein [Bifidobacteriaceae bacterium]|nr:YlxR family protein [Bifidobacteriaceae bacterium]